MTADAILPVSPQRRNGHRAALCCALALLTLGLGGCETTQQATSGSQRFLSNAYQIPVAVPAFHGRMDRTRSRVVQNIIVRPGQPATFRMSVDVRRADAQAELKGFVRGTEVFSVPALRMRPGDPAIPVVIALPVDNSSQLIEMRLQLLPGTSEAAFDVSGASVTIGEVAPTAVTVDEVR